MSRIICIIFTVLTAVIPALGQEVADVNSASERFLSPVRALGRSEIAGHNAGSFLLWDIPTYSEIKAVYDFRREGDALLPQEGNGLDQGSVKVSSLIRLRNHSAVRAGAEYSRGVKRNVLWNSTSDFELLYPDVMVDTIGGNHQKEQYSFYGAWSKLMGKAHMGIYGGYRALHEYRQIDPRPRSITSDLNAVLTGGITAKGYIVDINAAIRVYKQSQDVSFYDPLGANTSELHFTGLGSHFARFDGAGDFTSSRYNGHGWEVSATLIPGHQDGWTGLFSYNSLDIECLLTANNEVPITDLWIQKLDGMLGYRHLSGGVKWNILAETCYELRQSTENIIDTGKNNEYAVLSSMTMYRNRILSVDLKGAVEVPSAAGTICAEPVFEYYRSSAEYIFPKREMSFSLAETGLKIGLRRMHKGWLFSANVRLHRTFGLDRELSIPKEYTEERILEHYEHFHSMISSGRTTAGLAIGIQRKVGQNTAVFLRPDFTFRSIDGFGQAEYLTAAIGLAF